MYEDRTQNYDPEIF